MPRCTPRTFCKQSMRDVTHYHGLRYLPRSHNNWKKFTRPNAFAARKKSIILKGQRKTHRGIYTRGLNPVNRSGQTRKRTTHEARTTHKKLHQRIWLTGLTAWMPTVKLAENGTIKENNQTHQPPLPLNDSQLNTVHLRPPRASSAIRYTPSAAAAAAECRSVVCLSDGSDASL